MIIKSLLDTDLYKFTMMQLVFHHYPDARVEYRFQCRTPGVNFIPYIKEIRAEIDAFCQLTFQADELAYLRQLSFIQADFVDFLSHFQLNKNSIEITTHTGFELVIKGPWLQAILFEVPVLAIISEIYSRHAFTKASEREGRRRLAEKIRKLKAETPLGECKLVEFGTRRRYSSTWQEEVIQTLSQGLPDNLLGTSNVYFARQYDLPPIGTMAHEYIQAFQVLAPRLIESQHVAFEKWIQEYRGALGIALSDTYNVDVFLRDFDSALATIYDGIRQDSGDPFAWGEKIIAHYRQLRIDPLTKTIVFSDALTIDRVIQLFWHFKPHIKTVFGIGTHLTNDLGEEAIQIVIKMTACNGHPVAKLSDSPTKTITGDAEYLERLKAVFGV